MSILLTISSIASYASTLHSDTHLCVNSSSPNRPFCSPPHYIPTSPGTCMLKRRLLLPTILRRPSLMPSAWSLSTRRMGFLSAPTSFYNHPQCDNNTVYRSRVCIKIPSTPESIIACQHLEKIGIRTLATCLFSIPQAVAASQAGCLYVAPYFNGMYLR